MTLGKRIIGWQIALVLASVSTAIVIVGALWRLPPLAAAAATGPEPKATLACSVEGIVDLQRRNPRGHSSWITELRINAFQQGQQDPVESSVATSDAEGVAYFYVTDAGIYDIGAKAAHALESRAYGVELHQGYNPGIDLGTLLEGDADDSNVIDGADFSLLAASFWTGAEATDFNEDGITNVLDYSLLYDNYGLSGPRPAALHDHAHSVPQVAGPWQGAVQLEVDSLTVTPGQIFQLPIRVLAGGNELDAIEAHLSFNPTELRVVDETGSDDFAIIPGSALGTVIRNVADNDAGSIQYAAGVSFGAQPVAADFVLATIRFQAVSLADPSIVGVSAALVCRSGTPYQLTVRDGQVRVLAATPTVTPTQSPTPTATASPTQSLTATPTASGSPTYNPTPTSTATVSPTGSPTPTPTGALEFARQWLPIVLSDHFPGPTLTATIAPTRSPTPTRTVTVSPTHNPTPTPTATGASGSARLWLPLVFLDHSPLSTRFGVNGSLKGCDLRQLGSVGWYHSWTIEIDPPRPGGIEFVQLIRLRSEGSEYWPPDWGELEAAVEANPGSLWLIGNEPDVETQDNCTPQEYAERYHACYTFIKARDASARVSGPGIVQPTALRLQWLDLALSAYEAAYGERMPVDVWNIHVQILPERRDGWGCEIPPGLPDDLGEDHQISDNASVALFEEKVLAFREWMRDNGEREKPLIISEYGVLMPSGYGYLGGRDINLGDQIVMDFMAGTFSFCLEAADPLLGYQRDGDRLVQRWAWYSVKHRMSDLGITPPYVGFNGSLFEWARDYPGALTQFGRRFRDYLAAAD